MEAVGRLQVEGLRVLKIVVLVPLRMSFLRNGGCDTSTENKRQDNDPRGCGNPNNAQERDIAQWIDEYLVEVCFGRRRKK